MSANAKKSMTATIALILFGALALFAGEKWLWALIPAAALVWYAANLKLRSGRN
jgi:hypothetical protein